MVVTDEFALGRPSKDVTLSLMTPCDVAETAPGTLEFRCAALPERTGEPLVVHARFDGQALAARVEQVDLPDLQLSRVWGTHLHRVVLTARTETRTGNWTLTVVR